MNSVPLQKSGAAFIRVGMSAIHGAEMPVSWFLVDTGATRTTIPKSTLVERLGYDDNWILNNRIILPEEKKPKMANNKRADVYEIPAMIMSIGGTELLSDRNLLTSDSIELNFLLGMDILSYFKFLFDFDKVDEDAPYGRMFYEFRESRRKHFTELGKPFAYQLEGK